MGGVSGKYLGYYFFSNLIFQKSIFMIFLTTHSGISASQISLLEVTLLLSTFLTEVPAGVIGDKFGRRFCVITGLSLLSLSSIGFTISSSYIIFLLLFGLEGAGMAFISGADEALLYDNLKINDNENAFLSTLGNARTLSYIALATAAVFGGVIQTYSWNIVYGLTSLALIIAIVFILGVPETFSKEELKKTHMREEIISFFKSREGNVVLLIFMILSIFEGTALSFIMFSQHFFQLIGIDTETVSLIVTMGRFLTGISLFITPKISKLISAKFLISITMLLACLSFFLPLVYFRNSYIVIYICMTTLPYVSSLLNINLVHSLIPSKVRASVVSVGNAVSSILLGISYLLIGFILDYYSLNSTVFTLGGLNMMSVILYLILFKRCFGDEIHG